MSNQLLFDQQYGTKTVVKAVDECKNEQYAATRTAIRHENRCESL